MSDLLATIVASRRLQPEPVATDALVHLCATSDAAASVMADLLAELCPGSATTGLRFTGQDVDPDTDGRPDLVATDSGGTRLVIEAKFDAALTEAQTGSAYVGKLKPGVSGALVFLVPADRLRNLWRTVSVTPGGAMEPATIPDGALAGGVQSMPLSTTGHVLAAMSWETLLHRMDAAMAKQGDTEGLAELAQLRGLVQWRTAVGWVPLAPEDLPQRVGRQLHAVHTVMKSVAQQVAATSKGKTRNGSGDNGFGRHVSTASGKSIWFGTWTSWWDRFGPGPAWAQIKFKTPHETTMTSEALSTAGIRHHPRQGDIIIPLDLPLGVEKNVVEASVLVQINAIIATLDTLDVEVVEDTADPTNGVEEPEEALE